MCATALFLVGLDTTIVTTGLPAIGHAFGATAAEMSWVVDAYTIPFASLLVTSGALADRFGRRRVLRTGLVVFAVASLACAAAPSLGLLIAARAIQGVGASMLSPVALAIVVNVMTDARERALAIGVWGSMFGISMAAGPITGGALVAVFGWPSVFWAAAPVIAVVLVAVALVVPESRAALVRRLDPAGQVLVVAVLAVGVGLVIEGPGLGRASPVVLAGIAALALLVATLLVVERRVSHPLVEPALFRDRLFAGAIAAAAAVFVAFSATLVTATFLLQSVWGWEALAAGAASLPMAVAAAALAPVSGALVGRGGARPLLVAAGLATAAGGGALLLAVGGAGTWAILVAFCLVGTGLGLANAPITSTAVSGLPADRAGVAGGMASTARQVGISVGVALAGSLTARAAPETFGDDAAPAVWAVIACGALVAGVGALRRPPALDEASL